MATDIGTTIKRARERKRWSQQELANRLGVNRKTVDNWENGRTQPASSIGALEDLLGISFSDADRSPPARELSERTRQLMREELGDEMAARLIAHAEHLASGRTPPAAPEDDHPRESGGRGRRSAG